MPTAEAKILCGHVFVTLAVALLAEYVLCVLFYEQLLALL